MWKPISLEELERLIAEELAECTPEQRERFNSIRGEPTKWQLEPWGNEGGGFWVVARVPGQVLWYNDIEEGFNWSSYSTEGVIGQYWCNQDALRHAMHALHHPIMKLGPPQPLG